MKHPGWQGESRHWPQGKKLLSLNPVFREKVKLVLAALDAGGWHPKIVYGWRSVEVQQHLYKLGRTKVRFSFHNAQTKHGIPNAYAVDVIDARYAWDLTAGGKEFFDALGVEAKKLGLFWGGDWAKFHDWAHVQLFRNAHLAVVKKESGM
jgi:hypothetical protein